MSAAQNYSLPDRRTTNSLCVHYLAHHRPDVPAEQLARVASLTYGLAEPSEEELRGGRWRGNRLGDFFGRDLVAAFVGGGLDLSNAYLETEGAAQEGAYHHVLGSLASMPIKAVPVLIDAISQTDGGIDRWMASAFWPARWKEAWIAPLLTVLATADRDIRLWGVHSLGNLGDTLGTWRNYVFVGDDLKDVEVVRATGITGSQGRDVGSALLEVMLRDPDGKVRSAALRAISGLGAAGEAAVPALVRIMRRSRHVEQRMAAIRALRNIAPLTPNPAWMPQSVSILRAALKDKSKEMRRAAADTLRHLGPEGCRLAFTALQDALTDEDRSVRSASEAAIRLVESQTRGPTPLEP